LAGRDVIKLPCTLLLNQPVNRYHDRQLQPVLFKKYS
jgi:hypothetical protein